MPAWTYVVMFFCLGFLALIALGFWRSRVIDRAYRADQEAAYIREQEADAVYYELFAAEQLAIQERYYSGNGAILDLVGDLRLNLCGSRTKEFGRTTRVPTMKRDVYDWCRGNVQSQWEMVPYMHGSPVLHRIWFEDPNDAMHFKMRWY